jgi:NAD(P)-dependent dehydrogenase (short-subunit alcohol dehydrogenase family)
MADQREFAGGCAVIAGGSGVIGAAIANGLAEMGSDIALTFRSNRAAAEKVAEEIRARGRDVHIAKLDLVDEAATGAFSQEAIARFGFIHSAVYAAGPSIKFNLVNQITPQEWKRVIEGDAIACFNFVSAVLPHFRERKAGAFLGVLTAAVDRSPPRDILSAAPKAAIQMLMRSIALEEGRSGIRANCVSPGYILDGIGASMIGESDGQFVEKMLRAIPMKRAGLASEVADAACFLLSKKAGYVSGATIPVAGGLQLA